jgi:hypothetical protein
LLAAVYLALRAALRARSDADVAQAPMRRAAFMMVLLILVHSLLEYPLWYAYFLLPAAFAFGICLGVNPGSPESVAAGVGVNTSASEASSDRTRPLVLASMLLILGGMGSVGDYARVVIIFAPAAGAPSLAERIADGQRSVFFSHHADYAAATTSEHPSDAMAAFDGAPHYLLDARLMLAWAKALDEAGDTQRASYVAQRLREFNNDQADAFFEPCTAAAADPQTPLPFQCVPPAPQGAGSEPQLRYEDFR